MGEIRKGPWGRRPKVRPTYALIFEMEAADEGDARRAMNYLEDETRDVFAGRWILTQVAPGVMPCPSGDTDCTADCGWCKGSGTVPLREKR